ncbi:hypothetical protein DYB37_001782 [Aphanomyces astaci]|uniref:Uncharacterized protein n=1 Tax=Aphanomyces astaci TaxID=112090 RepID=A0A418EGN9_APHAT|nr:hypothetical protein DYB35_009078 [Aphanomyces astaci]RHZ12873.1 hypothetical protein DYB37_001782 [Aphanomyces astaci]
MSGIPQVSRTSLQVGHHCTKKGEAIRSMLRAEFRKSIHETDEVKIENLKANAVRGLSNYLVLANSSLYSCSRDTTIARHSLTDDNAIPTTFAGHSLTVSALAIDPSEGHLASGSRDTSVSLWDVATATRLQHTSTSQNIVTCMAWVPSDAHVVAQGGEDLRLRLWDTRTWKNVQTIDGYVYFPLSLACSPDGHYLFTSSKGFNAVGCEGRVWDRRTGKQVAEMTGHSQDATACAYIPGQYDMRLNRLHH